MTTPDSVRQVKYPRTLGDCWSKIKELEAKLAESVSGDEWLKLKEENLRLRSALENIAKTKCGWCSKQYLANNALSGEKEII